MKKWFFWSCGALFLFLDRSLFSSLRFCSCRPDLEFRDFLLCPGFTGLGNRSCYPWKILPSVFYSQLSSLCTRRSQHLASQRLKLSCLFISLVRIGRRLPVFLHCVSVLSLGIGSRFVSHRSRRPVLFSHSWNRCQWGRHSEQTAFCRQAFIFSDRVFFLLSISGVHFVFQKLSAQFFDLIVMSYWLGEVWIQIQDSFILFFFYLCFIWRIAFDCLVVCRWHIRHDVQQQWSW
jgi:hypothetical protein